MAVDRLLREVQTGAKVPVRTVDVHGHLSTVAEHRLKHPKIASSQAAVRTIGNKAGTVQVWVRVCHKFCSGNAFDKSAA